MDHKLLFSSLKIIGLFLLFSSLMDLCASFRIRTAKESYKPVVMVHGVMDGGSSLDDLKGMILKAHPGTNVTSIDLFSEGSSLAPLWPQVHDFGNALKEVMAEAKDGVHLICFSQGGVICRGMLATIPDHNVQSFIALSSPLMGQFGDTSSFKFLPPQFRKEVYKFCYKSFGQDHISVCQYWNDPHHQDLFANNGVYLAVLNNQTNNINSTDWKQNFIRIKNLVMIGGPDDGVITPWQSSHFGFYDDQLNVVEMENQTVFKEDYFGLQTLYKRKAITKCIVSGVEHIHWHGNQKAFDKCIEPWLD